jgi:miniconductance mechanosensitive channel
MTFIRNLVELAGLKGAAAEHLALAIGLAAVAGACVLAHFLVRRPLLSIAHRFIKGTESKWDDPLVEHKVLEQLAHVAPALVFYLLAPLALEGHPLLLRIAHQILVIYVVIIGARAMDLFLSAVSDVWSHTEGSRDISIKSFVQFFKIIIYVAAGVIILSGLLGRSPMVLLSGLTALTAVVLLVFRDTILGLVAGIQLSANRMVAVGDWIEMSKYGADGAVLEVALTTVKVQNWDKTITTIPTYALISESFKNWRGMQESGGRRIKRSINIDIRTIKHCDEEMLRRFGRIQYISEYIERKQAELAAYNQKLSVDLQSLANGRRMTNVGTFRAYVISYLRNHARINQDMTFLVRQLAPTEYGLPLEVYVFCNDVNWVNYEAVQADIFDHLLAIAPEFDLSVFQAPSGEDFRRLSS